ncbi:MAG: ABC transporter ATP-binding protein/permease [Defluviitaleaceae bacterium]|nr:ABC transporter ATP-binding protein/permease [Defluviitaleaceae bacterium]
MDFSKKLTFRGAMLIPFRLAPLQTTLLVLQRAVNVAVNPLNVFITASFINTALAVFTNGAKPSGVVPPLLGLAAVQAYYQIIGSLMELAGKNKGIKLRRSLRAPFMEKRARLEFRHVENQKVWDLVTRTWEKPEDKLNEVLDNVLGFLELTLTSVSYAVILLTSAPLAGAAIIAVSIPVFWLSFKGGKASYDAERETSKRRRKYEFLAKVLTSREAVHERNMFGFTGKLNEMYYSEYEASRKFKLRVRAKWFVRAKSLGLAVSAIAIFAMFALLPSAVGGGISVGLFISLTAALFGIINWLSWGIPNNFQTIARNREYIKDLNEFFALSEQAGATDLPSERPISFETLEFRDVSFTYPGTDKKVLDGFSLKIEVGKHYSFVGANGAGKTTATKLITRLYDGYEGEILLNGKELRTYELKDIKACFTAVFQDFARYDVTIAENVALGKSNGASPEDIDRAMELAGFSGKVAELKDGKNTVLGKTRDEGIDLSGGEWQRVAMARAVVSPSPVKILDEPTAALDPVAESEIYAKFEEISRGQTTIFISHRLGSATLADEIFVIDGGKVAERGSHAELMEKSGVYAEMFESQRSWYVG